MTLRQRYFVVLSVGFVVLGIVIVVRSLLQGAPPVAIFGGVLIALGLVRIREFLKMRQGSTSRGS